MGLYRKSLIEPCMPTKVGRFDRSRRASAIWLTVIVAVMAAAAVAGIIYFYYTTRRF